MTNFLRRWVAGTSVEAAPSSSPIMPSLLRVSPPLSDDGTETETEHDDDSPPAFPSPFSAQRIASSSIPRILTDSQSMPPPPPPHLASRNPGISVSSAPSSSSLAAPPTTTKRPVKPKKQREKVALAPGHSSLDWASLKSSGEDLRGVDTLMRIPPSVLKLHNKRSDAWSAFNGKVYNITPYLSFHPGGERELMRAAGRDGTKLFASTHAWVNVDFMLDACLVGFLVAEP